jgi:hypothetical protein
MINNLIYFFIGALFAFLPLFLYINHLNKIDEKIDKIKLEFDLVCIKYGINKGVSDEA